MYYHCFENSKVLLNIIYGIDFWQFFFKPSILKIFYGSWLSLMDYYNPILNEYIFL
jgi:hypothetical protein